MTELSLACHFLAAGLLLLGVGVYQMYLDIWREYKVYGSHGERMPACITATGTMMTLFMVVVIFTDWLM